MKHFKVIFNALRGSIWALLITTVTPSAAQADSAALVAMDSVEISLLTCQPHDEIYSLYGHTAIRFHELRQNGNDLAFNYGVFDFHRPHFVARFVFGLTDYELGAYPYSLFLQEYRHFGALVTEQVLNLSAAEKLQLVRALGQNLQAENRVYRYNIFYNNCTTKARDIIESAINGKLEYAPREDYEPSFREMVHEQTRNHPWAAFGNDFLLGVLADRKTDLRQQEFLPANLMFDFDHAQIYADGTYRPLVKERRIASPAGVQLTTSSFPLRPIHCAWLFALIVVTLMLVEYRQKRLFRWWDAAVALLLGIAGLVPTVMLFSQHPTTNLNLQILLFNPLHLFFLPAILRRHTKHYGMALLAMCVLLLLGSLLQHYAEGMIVLALCLLLRSCWLIKNPSKR